MTVQVQKNCEVVTDVLQFPETAQPQFFSLECGDSFVAYESLFQSTRVTGTLNVQVFDTTCNFRVTIERNGELPFDLFILSGDTNRYINVTVDCLRRISFSCEGGLDQVACEGLYFLQLHWCKCC